VFKEGKVTEEIPVFEVHQEYEVHLEVKVHQDFVNSVTSQELLVVVMVMVTWAEDRRKGHNDVRV